MHHWFRYVSGLIILFLVSTILISTGASAMEMEESRIYTLLLKRHVAKDRVNYNGFKTDENLLDKYLDSLSRTKISSLSEKDQFAFYINAYNAFTIKLVLTKYPGINSIKEISGFFSNPWNQKFIVLQDKTVSLDYIEHKILRPRFKDPRIHFAINCASKSCPPLRGEPYDGDRLDSQLDNQARQFINNKKNTFIKEDTLFISKLFKWFEDDFSDNPLIFIRHYAGIKLKQELDSLKGKRSINYLYYDWSLNQ